MPPWKPAAPTGAFHGERRLSDAEILALEAWAAGRRSLGSLPPVAAVTEAKPDWEGIMPEPFAVPSDGPDLYQCIVIPARFAQNRWVRAVDFRPGNPRVTHHAVLFAGKPEQSRYSCFGAPGFLPARSLGGWSPGNRTFAFPEGTAALLPAGHDVVVQIHYHPSGKPETDQSAVRLWFQPEAPRKTLMDIPLGSNRIDIAPGENAYRVRDGFTIPVDVDLLGIIPHMHYVGKAVRGWAVLPGGQRRTLLLVPDWDFNWQDRYWYRRPVRLPAGTRVEAEFVYDNSAANLRNPSSPPRRVTWGFGVTDEMAGLHLQVTTVEKHDAEELGQTLWGKMMRVLGGR